MTNYHETLVSPEGRVVNVTSPAEYNDLRYGQGYRVTSEDQPEREPERVEPETGEPVRENEPVEEPDGSIREDDAPSDE